MVPSYALAAVAAVGAMHAQSDTTAKTAKTAKDHPEEKHVCPLQLGLIDRCVDLWSAPGELVFSPFAGIGSEGYAALKLGRRFIGAELKDSYYRQAVKNLAAAGLKREQDEMPIFANAAKSDEAEDME